MKGEYDLIKPVTDRLGLKSAVRSAYMYYKMGSKRTINYSAAQTSADFKVRHIDEYRFFRNSDYEMPYRDEVLTDLRPDDVFYDLGSRFGLYACLAGSTLAGSEGEVIAVEPNPYNVTRIIENIQLNDIDGTIIPAAAHDEDGYFPLDVTPRKTDGSRRLSNEPSILTVPSATIDSLATQVNPPDILKIDVEGNEDRVLDGMTKQLGQCRSIYCEVHTQYGNAAESVISRLEEHGYTVKTIMEPNNLVYLKAKLDY